MDPERKRWNEQQQALRAAFAHPAGREQAVALFLAQHAAVHAAAVAGGGGWSFDDEVWQGLSEENARCIPPGGEHSIAWITWHLARIEDVTMNLLAAGSAPVFEQGGWQERLGSPISHTGNGLSEDMLRRLSAGLDLAALRAYRLAVGRRTREIVQALPAGAFKQKVDPDRLARVAAQGAVAPGAREVLDYWGGLTIAGLLLMPPTRHNFIHLNEALRLKGKGGKNRPG